MEELISAIGSLWKLAACISVPVCVYLLRKPLAQLIPKLRRIKRGNTEINLHEEKEASSGDKRGPDKAAPPPEEETPRPPDEDERPFQTQIFDALVAKETDNAEAIFKQKVKEEPKNRIKHEVFYFELRCDVLKDTASVRKLESFLEDDDYTEHKGSILHTLGRFYIATEQYDLAYSRYQEAETSATSAQDRDFAIAGAARALVAADHTSKAITALQSAIASSKVDEGRACLFRSLADAHATLGNDLEKALALEKVAELKPTDTDAVFKAAYSQREADLLYLSLHNYLRQLKLSRDDSTARNNYAVQLSELELPFSSVRQYRRAEADGNTLAMANLAYLLLNKGFADEAKQILQKAQKKDDYHGNVDNALAKIHTDQAAEDKKMEAVKSHGNTYQRLCRRLADALLLPAPRGMSFAGNWRMPDGKTLTVTSYAGNFSAEWREAYLPRKLEGHQINRGAKAKLYLEKYPSFSTSEKINYANPTKVLAFLSENGNQIEVISLGKEDPVFLTMTREPGGGAEQPPERDK